MSLSRICKATWITLAIFLGAGTTIFAAGTIGQWIIHSQFVWVIQYIIFVGFFALLWYWIYDDFTR